MLKLIFYFIFIINAVFGKYNTKKLSANYFDQNDIVCRDEITGEPIDWFTLYKLPKKAQKILNTHKKLHNEFISQGTAYTYMTNQHQEWRLSNLNINDTFSLPGRTLQQIYSNDSSIGYIFYNDQADQVTMINGHTKGVILFNENNAVWIVHSIPHYPPKKSENSYFIRPSQCVFGQSMLCMSFKFDQLDQIGRQMLFNYPQVYDYYIPEKLKNSNNGILDNLMAVINKQHVTTEPWHSVKELRTRGGEVMLSISKFSNFKDDLYSGLVSNVLNSNLLTETWNNGQGTLRSNCTAQWNVLNIKTVNFEVANLKFSVHNDHSKWAVTYEEDNSINEYLYNYGDESNELARNEIQVPKVACLGDINRQIDQFKRAGGTVCFLNNTRVWEQFHNLVYEVEECQKVKVKSVRYNKIQAEKPNEKIILL
ncbi:unnamed protein product [Brachionus calyciflorus]|uniref:Uncharacterized protein n=1 Tax=Brachionus calyciflorus TaxID=104777 RepID=A0A813PJU4_9BILA|nr:unnamed protein product [Brachionus calyciflorus]